MYIEEKYPYLFSVIMSVYNVKPFLQEAVESIIDQDIGFDKIQIVFVDDGSSDGSSELCDIYKAKYPENIVVIHKTNGGLSSARNEGLKHVTGRFVNFCDLDDKLSLNTCSEVFQCFESYGTQIDMVAIPLFFFDGAQGAHPTNSEKFNNRFNLIDLEKRYDLIHTSCAASFIRLEKAKEISFDERLSAMEDAKALIPLLATKPQYGTSSNCKYYYRKRSGIGTPSLSQSASSQKRWYIPHLELFSYDTIALCLKHFKIVPKFAQYIIMYDLQWKFMQKKLPAGLLNEDETKEYKEKLYGLLQYMDDDVILKQRAMFSEHYQFIFLKKYPDMKARIIGDRLIATTSHSPTVKLTDAEKITVEFIEVSEAQLILDITAQEFNDLHGDNEFLYASINGTKVLCQKTERSRMHTLIDEPAFVEQGYRISVPLAADEYEIGFFRDVDGCWYEKKNIRYGKFAPVGNEYNHSYYYTHNYLIKAKKHLLTLKKCNKFKKGCQEICYLAELAKSKKTSDRKAFCVRSLHNIVKPFIRKPIWLISDKANRADDNGEAFFKYVTQHHSADVNAYFVISKNSPDYKRMKKTGKVISTLSWTHKFLFTLANKSISAYTHIEVNNPFRAYYAPYRDYLNHCEFIFLQHGITQNDVSVGLNKYNKNIACFITSAKPETEFICNSTFYYSKDQVALCGFPRYDSLYNDPQRIITIAPTWRAELFSGFIPEESRWIMKSGFEESDFYNFYNSLVNSKRLIESAKKHHYKIHYFPHSVFFPYIDKFKVDPEVTLCSTNRPYRVMFAESDLLITDYSSIAFDFAYLRKPVIYSQFDYDKFFSGDHSYRPGYYNYENNGFGEVVYDLEGTIDRIIEYMENECQLKEEYRRRIENFFTFNDKNNCRRVYERIMKMEETSKYRC